jgi:hypothetical protein
MVVDEIATLRQLQKPAPAGGGPQDPGKLGQLASHQTHAERPHLPRGPCRPTCQGWNTARTQPSRLFLNRSYPRALVQRHRMGGQVGRLELAACHPLSRIGSVHVLQLGHEVLYRGAFRTQLRATRRPDTAAETGRGRHSERRPYSVPGDVSPKGSRAVGQSLRCSTRVIRCRTRLICQRHRGSTRPGPRPRPASSGAPAHRAVCWLIPLPG